MTRFLSAICPFARNPVDGLHLAGNTLPIIKFKKGETLMTTWHDYVQATSRLPEWPYPLRFGKIREIVSDVLVIGGGVAGCRAAISAAQNGSTVALAERGNAKRSGAGGSGVDHWHGACTKPASRVRP